MNAHVSISELADMLHGRSNPWKVMALVEAYFDESWIGPAGCRITALAGFMAPSAVWSALEADWKEAWEPYEKQYGIKTFHMTDCVYGANKFARIDKFFRFSIITALSLVVGRHNVKPIWSAVINEDWNSVVADAAFLKRYPQPLDLCFDHIVQQMADLSYRNGFDGGVAPMFADQEQYNPRMMAVYNAYRQHPEWAKFMRPISFGPPSQVVALQAADMLAYGVALDWHDFEYPKEEWTLENFGQRKFMLNITGYRGMHTGGCFDARALENAIKTFRP